MSGVAGQDSVSSGAEEAPKTLRKKTENINHCLEIQDVVSI